MMGDLTSQVKTMTQQQIDHQKEFALFKQYVTSPQNRPNGSSLVQHPLPQQPGSPEPEWCELNGAAPTTLFQGQPDVRRSESQPLAVPVMNFTQTLSEHNNAEPAQKDGTILSESNEAHEETKEMGH